jgi:hypothetical protein
MIIQALHQTEQRLQQVYKYICMRWMIIFGFVIIATYDARSVHD